MSLAVFKPARVIGFDHERSDREWDPAKLAAAREMSSQPDLFDEASWRRTFQIVSKVPYRFFYRVRDGDGQSSRMQIIEWQIGALYWNCLRLAQTSPQPWTIVGVLPIPHQRQRDLFSRMK